MLCGLPCLEVLGFKPFHTSLAVAVHVCVQRDLVLVEPQLFWSQVSPQMSSLFRVGGPMRQLQQLFTKMHTYKEHDLR